MHEFFGIDTNNKLISLPPFDHKEAEDDDCGLPEHPIYSNYPKYLWTSHTRSGGFQRSFGVSDKRSARQKQTIG